VGVQPSYPGAPPGITIAAANTPCDVIHLRSLKLAPSAADEYPFSVPAVRATSTLAFTAPVTFFVGENGSGKSTLLEALAVKCRLPAVGSDDTATDGSLRHARALAKAMTLSWEHRALRGFFLRAEDFFGFTKRLAEERAQFKARLADLEEEYRDRSDQARTLAMGPARGSLSAMERSYGQDLDANSHGESFLKLFQARFAPDGLYLLDEPEAPLSPTSQLALLAMMQEMVAQGGQFIVATHSPILLAFPGADIWSFDEKPPAAVAYSECEHVRVTREFLTDPERFLRHLR
jgi:predicted ATPase